MNANLIDPKFWNRKKVFMTGHTGFKGSWLSLWLESLGAEVTGFSLEPETEPSLFKAAQVSKGMKSIIGDIRDLSVMSQALKESKAEIVIHMAAQALVRRSYAEPVETYATNVMGTVNLLEAVRQTSGVKSVVVVTSDKAYKNHEWVWGHRENEAMGGHDPYSSSKGCAELVTESYRSSFFSPKDYSKHGVGVASARAGNAIGGGDWSVDRLIPDVVRAVEKKQKVVIRNPHSTRPWQHALDPLAGYLCLAERLYKNGTEFAEGWNFGPGDGEAMEVESVVKSLLDLWNYKPGYEVQLPKEPLHEAHFLKLDCSKARSRLGWKPLWNLKSSLKSIVDWNQAYFENPASARETTLKQIREFYPHP